MPPPEENLQQPKDLDSMVSSFLAELDAISVELQTPPASVEAAPAKPELKTAAISQNRTNHIRSGQIILISIAAVAIVIAGWLYFRTPGKSSFQQGVQQSQPILPDTQPSAALNDTALLLAGRLVASTSPLYRLSLSPAMQKHRKEMQVFWRRTLDGNLARIQRWQDQNIPDRLQRNPVLYPLSGADYLNAYAFFPHASEYLLLSLESPGEIPDITRLGEREIDRSLSAIRFTVQSITWVNYLQSRPMREELTNSSFHGVVPLIVLFAAGFGHTIRDVHPVMIGPDGVLVVDHQHDPPGKFRRVAGVNVPDDRVRGVRIRFTDGTEGTQKSITYLQIELRDRLFETAIPERRFLIALKNQNTILKSAVYLLHGNSYSKVSDFIRSSSNLLIQDDSGIPFDHFRDAVWQEYLFGRYTGPEPLGTLTHPPHQPLLAQRYASGGRPLSFPYGYGGLWGENRSNLMLFVKK